MRIYHIKHKFSDIAFEFVIDEFKDQLVSMKIDGELSEEQYEFVMQRIPLKLAHIAMWKKFDKFNLTEEKKQITFEEFYDKYGNKVGKKQAQNTWNRMRKADRQLAYNYIYTYKSKLKPGTELKYPATYLDQEPWND